MTDSISAPSPSVTLRKLKACGQLLEPTLFLGKAGVSGEFLRGLETELNTRELVKVKFVAFKEEKKNLSKQLAIDSKSLLVMRVGNVAVLYRQNPDPARRKYES